MGTDLSLDESTWSSAILEAVKEKEVGIIPYKLELDYSYWTYRT